QRRADAIGVGLEVLERGALRTEVPVREHVVTVAAHERDRASVEMQLEATRRFTKVARAVLDPRHDRRLREREPVRKPQHDWITRREDAGAARIASVAPGRDVASP